MNGLFRQICIHRFPQGETILGLVKSFEVRVFGYEAEHTEGGERNDEIVVLSTQRSWLSGFISKLQTVRFRENAQTRKKVATQGWVLIFIQERMKKKMVKCLIKLLVKDETVRTQSCCNGRFSLRPDLDKIVFRVSVQFIRMGTHIEPSRYAFVLLDDAIVCIGK